MIDHWRFAGSFGKVAGMKYLVLATLLALPAQAETILPPSAFEAFADRSTVYFTRRGAPYGAEQYLRNRKVIWQFTDGTCSFGEWFPSGDQLCFQYDGPGGPLCWNYLETDAGNAVRMVGDDPADDLLIAGQDKMHLECAAPNVGASFRP